MAAGTFGSGPGRGGGVPYLGAYGAVERLIQAVVDVDVGVGGVERIG